MTNLAELLGPDLQPPEDQPHCCACDLCVSPDDVADAKHWLVPERTIYRGGTSLKADAMAVLERLDEQIKAIEDKPGATKAVARLTGLYEDLDDWIAKLIDYARVMANDITTCDDTGHCEQHDTGPDPDRGRE